MIPVDSLGVFFFAAFLALRIHPMATTWSSALEGLHVKTPRGHPLGAATKAIGACGRAQLWQWALEVSDFVKVQGGTWEKVGEG